MPSSSFLIAIWQARIGCECYITAYPNTGFGPLQMTSDVIWLRMLYFGGKSAKIWGRPASPKSAQYQTLGPDFLHNELYEPRHTFSKKKSCSWTYWKNVHMKLLCYWLFIWFAICVWCVSQCPLQILFFHIHFHTYLELF